MKNRLQRFLVVSTLLLMIIPLSLLVIRTAKASGDWQQPVSYFSSMLLSNNSSTYVGNCVADESEFVGSSYSAGGALDWSISSATGTMPCPLAIDAVGAIYTIMTTVQSGVWTEHITKYAYGQVVWDVAQSNGQTILALSLGTDGNLYAITDSNANTGGYIGLLGINPVLTAGETSPQIILNEPLGIQAGKFSGLSVYKNGLVLSSSSNVVNGELLQYFGYDGSTQLSVNILNPGAVDIFAATLDGRVFVPQVDTTTSQCTPDPTGYADESNVVAYDPTGQQWSYTLPSCSVVYAVRPTPDGGIILWINNNGNKQYLLSVSGNGTTRWPNPIRVGGSSNGTSYALNALYVTTSGDIATVENYTQSDNNEGVIIDFNSGSDGSQLWHHDFIPTANQGGYTYSGGGNPGFGIAQGMAYILITHCMYSTNGGVPGCGGQTLFGLNAPGMALDYPRGALFEGIPIPTPTPTTCPAIRFFGVRGSGEKATDYNGYGKTVAIVKDILRKNLPHMNAQAIDYPAVPVLQGGLNYGSVYLNSVSQGITNLSNSISNFTKNCPNTYLILAGYSQGAQVVGDVFDIFDSFPNSIVGKILAVIMFGDPRFNPKQPKVDFGLYDKTLSGSFQIVDSHMRQMPSKYVHIVHSYCLLADPICNFSPGNLAQCLASLPTCSHFLYWNGWSEIAAEWTITMVPPPIR